MGRVEKYEVEWIGLSDEFDVRGEGESRKISEVLTWGEWRTCLGRAEHRAVALRRNIWAMFRNHKRADARGV